MRAVACAYGEVGHACLSELLGFGAEVPLVITHRDAPGERIWFRSVEALARDAGARVLLPDDVNAPAVVGDLRGTAADFLFSFYFRQMMRPAVLATARRAALNMHGSLLPRYRGRAPVNWALVHGESETGVTLHYMDEKADHGDVVAQQRVSITRDDTALSLTRKLAAAARELLRDVLPRLEDGTAPRIAQDHGAATYFAGRRPEDGRIDWRRSAEKIRNLVRAVTDPWPGAFSFYGRRRLLVWAAELRMAGSATAAMTPGDLYLGADGSPLVGTGQGLLELLDVTWEGGERCPGREWARQAGIAIGDAFADASAFR